jgi:hypothetical protein
LRVVGMEAQRPRVRISPSEVSFGGLGVGRRSSIVTVSIENQGPGILTLEKVALEGLHADDFRLVPGTCEGAAFVASDGICTLGLRFSPSASGNRRAQLIILHNGAQESHRIPLSGMGTDAATVD